MSHERNTYVSIINKSSCLWLITNLYCVVKEPRVVAQFLQSINAGKVRAVCECICAGSSKTGPDRSAREQLIVQLHLQLCGPAEHRPFQSPR